MADCPSALEPVPGSFGKVPVAEVYHKAADEGMINTGEENHSYARVVVASVDVGGEGEAYGQQVAWSLPSKATWIFGEVSQQIRIYHVDIHFEFML